MTENKTVEHILCHQEYLHHVFSTYYDAICIISHIVRWVCVDNIFIYKTLAQSFT